MRRSFLLPAVLCAWASGCAFGDDRNHGVDPLDAGPDDAATDGRPDVDARPVDAGPDAAPMACTLVPQSGCVGRACDVRSDGTTGCREITAAGTDNDVCAGATQCAAGHSCVETASEGSCLELCTSDASCAPSSGSRCAIQVVDRNSQPIPGARYCSQACSPRSGAGCPADWNCGVFDNADGDYTRCLPAGAGIQGSTCASQLDCDIGYDCVDHGAVTCARSCRVGAVADCSGSLSCRGFVNTPLVVAGVEWGVCL